MEDLHTESFEDVYVEDEQREDEESLPSAIGRREESYEERLMAFPGTTRLTSDSASSARVLSSDPTEARIKQDEFLRLQHERTIDDLRNRMAHLEQELQAGRKGGKEDRELRERLEAAVKQRDEAKRDCELLRAKVARLRESDSSQEGSTEVSRQLDETRKANAALLHSLHALNSACSETESRVSALEERIHALDRAYELQVQVTAKLQERLAQSSRPKEVMQAVMKEIAENEAQVREMEECLARAEMQCVGLNRAAGRRDSPRQFRGMSSGSSKDVSEPSQRALAPVLKRKKKPLKDEPRPSRRSHSAKPRTRSSKRLNNRS